MPSRRTEIGLLHLDRQEPIFTTHVNANDGKLIKCKSWQPWNSVLLSNLLH